MYHCSIVMLITFKIYDLKTSIIILMCVLKNIHHTYTYFYNPLEDRKHLSDNSLMKWFLKCPLSSRHTQLEKAKKT